MKYTTEMNNQIAIDQIPKWYKSFTYFKGNTEQDSEIILKRINEAYKIDLKNEWN